MLNIYSFKGICKYLYIYKCTYNEYNKFYIFYLGDINRNIVSINY